MMNYWKFINIENIITAMIKKGLSACMENNYGKLN